MSVRKGCETGKAPGSQPGQVHHGEASHTKRISTGVGCDLRASAKRTDERNRLVGKGKVHKHGDVKDLRDYPHAADMKACFRASLYSKLADFKVPVSAMSSYIERYRNGVPAGLFPSSQPSQARKLKVRKLRVAWPEHMFFRKLDPKRT